MKKLLFMLIALCTLSSCSITRIGNDIAFTSDYYEAERRIASQNVKTYIDDNGIKEVKSMHLNYTFQLCFWGYTLSNFRDKITFYDGDEVVAVIDKRIHKNYVFPLGSNSVRISVTPNGAYVKILRGYSIIKQVRM